ncbi:MAG: hypothetical protein V1781_01590 [Bacteroidota bacterium]
MTTYHWILVSGFLIFILSAILIFIKVFVNKRITDITPVKGNVKAAILYSFTKAMSPLSKESAYLHLPTYIAGMIFHIGTFLCFFWLIILFFNIYVNIWVLYISVLSICIAVVCGISILIKRIVKVNLRRLSNTDDYFSNLVVVGFQIITTISLLWNLAIPILFIYGALLFIYIPIGKIKHTIYFFSSRIYLGIYYGRRGVWPTKR